MTDTAALADHAPKRRGVTLLTLCIAVLVAQVDTAVVNLATRAIGAYFHAGVGALQWVVDSYNLTYAVLLLTGGLLADLYGRRRIFMAGTTIFTIASLLCALAPSVSVLIAARALAGVGAALLLPASLAIVRVVWRDPVERGRALGIWAACNGVAMAIGPTLGGVLIRHFGWRSIFFVVVPLSIAAMLLAIPAVPESSDPHGRHFDGAAQVAGALALGALAYAAIVFREAPAACAIAGCIAVASFVAFVAIERRHGEAALVPLDIFLISAFRGAIAATTGMTFGMYGVLFLLPLTWQSVGRLDSTGAGLALLPMALVFVVVSPWSGPLSERIGARDDGRRCRGDRKRAHRDRRVGGRVEPVRRRNRPRVDGAGDGNRDGPVDDRCGRRRRRGALGHRQRARQRRADDWRDARDRGARHGVRRHARRRDRPAGGDVRRRGGSIDGRGGGGSCRTAVGMTRDMRARHTRRR